jgi:hypothetical protein
MTELSYVGWVLAEGLCIDETIMLDDANREQPAVSTR